MGTTYFVTSRLADSVPAEVQKRWQARHEEWLRSHGLGTSAELIQLPDELRHEYHREFAEKFHQLLDEGSGACVLRNFECAALLRARLLAGHGSSYQLDAWVIMPNHMHVLVEPAKGTVLGDVLRHWKGGSAHDINKHLQRRDTLWQAEPFDHIVRSKQQFDHYRHYIALNPETARLRGGYELGVGTDFQLTADAVLARFGLKKDPGQAI